MLWVDSYISFESFSQLNKYQKANHFPGMSELAKCVSRVWALHMGTTPAMLLMP